VPLSGGGGDVALLDVMPAAEETILDAAATNGELLAAEHDLARVRHAA